MNGDGDRSSSPKRRLRRSATSTPKAARRPVNGEAKNPREQHRIRLARLRGPRIRRQLAAQTLEFSTSDAAIASLPKASATCEVHHVRRARPKLEEALQPRYRLPAAQAPRRKLDATLDPASDTGLSRRQRRAIPVMGTDPHDTSSCWAAPPKTIARLDTYFTKLDEVPRSVNAFMGNEPDYQDPYIYSFAQSPAKTASAAAYSDPRYGPNTAERHARPRRRRLHLGLVRLDHDRPLSLYPGVGGFVVAALVHVVTVRLKDGVLKITAPNAAPTNRTSKA